MSHFSPEKLNVTFLAGVTPTAPVIPRFYTLTHSDRTGDLFLTIGPQHHKKQYSGWYTRLMRDEVLAEWRSEENEVSLHVHCQVSKGLGSERFRDAIFRRELPLVLKAIRYGDRAFFECHFELDDSQIWVHFHAKKPPWGCIENWGSLSKFVVLGK